MNQKRKRILFVTGPVTPLHSTNASLMLRLLSELQHKADCDLLSVGPYSEDGLAVSLEGLDWTKYSTVLDQAWHGGEYACSAIPIPSTKRFCAIVSERLLDRKGYQDYRPAANLRYLIEVLCRQRVYDTVFASNEPYAAAYALSQSRIRAAKALYLIDPFAELVPLLRDSVPPFRHRTHKKILEAADLILTTPRTVRALRENDYKPYLSKTVAAEFPLFSRLQRTESPDSLRFDPKKINLLYCGWLRNEACLRAVVERLDSRFCVTFLGNDNAGLRGLQTEAELRTLPAVPREIAVNAILDADILLSTGNPYPVHIPSKTFDYLASGKPVVHFYSIPDCPALEYYQTYPLALRIPNDSDAFSAANLAVKFCVENRGKQISFREVCGLYPNILADDIIKDLIEIVLSIGDEG